MDNVIHDPSTWHNLNRLRDHVCSMAGECAKISLLIDCDSGEINIPQPIFDLESRMQQGKKKGELRLRHAELWIEKRPQGIAFEMKEFEGEIRMEERAVRVIEEMLRILNREGAKYSSLRETLLYCVRSVKMDLNFEIAKEVSWKGQITRIEAEKMLDHSPIGTYLLREGGIDTQRVEYNLGKNNPFPVRCYVMTVVEEGSKISDKLLLQRANGWTVFNDDLQLGNYSYASLSSVIASMGGRYPLTNIKKAA